MIEACFIIIAFILGFWTALFVVRLVQNGDL